MKSVGKGRGLEVFSSKSSRKPKTCFAFARAIIPHHTTLWHCHPPKEPLWRRGLSYLVWSMERGILWDTGGKGTTHLTVTIFIQGSLQEDNCPAFSEKSSLAGPLQWWSVFWVYQRCRFLCLQVLLVPGPCHAQLCPSQLQSPDLAWGCRWVWKCVTSSSQVFSGSDLQQVMLFQTYGIQRCSHIPFVLCRL